MYENHRNKFIANGMCAIYGKNPPHQKIVVCIGCWEETTTEFLTLDHINNDGNKHRKKLRGSNKHGGGTHFYRWLRRNNYPKDNFQILCMNCNWARHNEDDKICPHKK